MSKVKSWSSSQAFCLGLAVVCGGSLPAWADRSSVKDAKSWSYQLQGDMASTQRSNADVAVVDPDHTGDPRRLKKKANGGKRDVLAYISIGEAEEGRAYMKGKSKQRWNTGQTQGWKGNYAAKYWDEEWKGIVKQRVSKAIAAGYDGVYLDRVDTYQKLKAPKGSRNEMICVGRELIKLNKI